MTATLTEAVVRTLTSAADGVFVTPFGVLAIILLLLVLVLKEVFRSMNDQRTKEWMRAFDIAMMPLILAFVAVILARFISLFGLR